MAKEKRKTGASRMAQLGYKAVTVYFDEVEVKMLQEAFPHRSRSQACKESVLDACKERGVQRGTVVNGLNRPKN